MGKSFYVFCLLDIMNEMFLLNHPCTLYTQVIFPKNFSVYIWSAQLWLVAVIQITLICIFIEIMMVG